MKQIFIKVPTEISGWKATDTGTVFNRDTIFKHINGGAELYLAYGFKEVLVLNYLGPDKIEMVLDIYDMGNSMDAFGVFSTEREDDEAGVGQDSEYGSGLLRFWKGHYFVSILAMSEDTQVKSTVLALGKAVAEAIQTPGAKPELIKYLPANGLDTTTIRFFHKQLQLNKHYYLSDDNILNLNDKTDCLLAEYPGSGEEPPLLLLVDFKSKDLCNKAYGKFLAAYIPEAQKTGLRKTENGKWVMVKVKNNLLQIVFDAPTKEDAEELIQTIKHL